MDQLQYMIDEVVKFRNERNWAQFHNFKDLALSLNLEASELLEHFQWKQAEEFENFTPEKKSEVADEIIDVINYALLLSHGLGIDLVEAFEKKMEQNRKKYPTDKARDNKDKYTSYL